MQAVCTLQFRLGLELELLGSAKSMVNMSEKAPLGPYSTPAIPLLNRPLKTLGHLWSDLMKAICEIDVREDILLDLQVEIRQKEFGH